MASQGVWRTEQRSNNATEERQHVVSFQVSVDARRGAKRVANEPFTRAHERKRSNHVKFVNQSVHLTLQLFGQTYGTVTGMIDMDNVSSWNVTRTYSAIYTHWTLDTLYNGNTVSTSLTVHDRHSPTYTKLI
jgi:hypothetical protein